LWKSCTKNPRTIAGGLTLRYHSYDLDFLEVGDMSVESMVGAVTCALALAAFLAALTTLLGGWGALGEDGAIRELAVAFALTDTFTGGE
jgi:hypothetical protein